MLVQRFSLGILWSQGVGPGREMTGWRQAEQIMGTPAYMSPEQAAGHWPDQR